MLDARTKSSSLRRSLLVLAVVVIALNCVMTQRVACGPQHVTWSWGFPTGLSVCDRETLIQYLVGRQLPLVLLGLAVLLTVSVGMWQKRHQHSTG